MYISFSSLVPMSYIILIIYTYNNFDGSDESKLYFVRQFYSVYLVTDFHIGHRDECLHVTNVRNV